LQLKTPQLKIYGPTQELKFIIGIDIAVEEDDIILFGTSKISDLGVGGHTIGHIAYYFTLENMVFVGDVFFSLGCGRIIEGTAKQFWKSLQTLRNLKDETIVYW